MLIPDTSEGIEIQFVLRPHNGSTGKSSDIWIEFRVFSYSRSDGWSEHCRGLVQAQYSQARSEVEQDRETRFEQVKHAQTIAEVRERCQSVAHPPKVYETTYDRSAYSSRMLSAALKMLELVLGNQ